MSCNIEKKARIDAEKAFDEYGKDEKLSAAQAFDRLAENYPGSNYFGRNIFNAAFIYQEIDSHNLAIERYKFVVAMPLKDDVKDSSRSIWETHTNFKHHAARNIGINYLRLEKLNEAKYWLYKAKNNYPYYSDSIKSKKREALAIDHLLMDIYKKQNKYDSAFITILPHALTKSPWNKLVARDATIDLIKSNFQPSEVLEELDAAFDNSKNQNSFIELAWHDFNVIVIPYKKSSLEMTPSYLKQTGLYIDLFRLVNHYDN